MTSHGSKYRNESPDEDLEWNSDNPVYDQFRLEMKTNHSELFDNLEQAQDRSLDHRKAPWNTEEHQKLHYTTQDESRYEYRLDPDSAAGKIFNSFCDAKWGTTDEQAEKAAGKLAKEMSDPTDRALSRFRDPDPNAYPRDSIPSLTEDTAKRVSGCYEDLYVALIHEEDHKFIDAISQLQGLSTDARIMEDNPHFRPSLIEALQESNPELAQELRIIKTQDGTDPAPSWMDSEHGAPSRDAIYDTITNPRVTDQNTGHAIARYNREITSDLVEHIAHPVDAKINTFRDEEQSKDDEESKHPAHTQMIIYLTSRLNDIESLIQYGLKQRDKDIYDQSIENLIRLNGEVELARTGEVPQDDWHDGTRFNDINQKRLATAREAASKRSKSTFTTRPWSTPSCSFTPTRAGFS